VASALTAYLIAIAWAHLGALYVIVLATPTFWCYGRSTAARRRGDFAEYARYHALWHLAGGLVASATLVLIYKNGVSSSSAMDATASARFGATR